MDNQQTSSSQPSTGNPQAVPQANPQALVPQSSILQNAGSQSVPAVTMLDQGAATLQTEVSNNAAALATNSSSVTIPLSTPASSSFPVKKVLLGGGIGLVVILCLAVAVLGLLRPRHN